MDIRPYLIAAIVALQGCATTEVGVATERAQIADVGSTAIALTVVGNAAEANPLGLYLLPLKYAFVRYVDSQPCAEVASAERVYNTIIYGAVGNNIAIAASMSPITGVVLGAGLFLAYRLGNPILCNAYGE